MILLLQFPEGLKRKALEYADKYREEGHEVYLASSPCFGACDLALEEAKAVGAQKIIHFGHSEFKKFARFERSAVQSDAPFIHKSLPVEVEYIEYKVDIDIKYLEQILEEFESYNSIAIATTVQHAHQIEEIKKFLESKGKKILVGKGKFAAYPGQILGCDAEAVTSVSQSADAILFIGDGFFHPLAISIKKPVFTYNPYTHLIERINSKIEKIRKKRKGMLAAAIVAKSFGILLSTKVGQFNPTLARKMKKELEEKGKRAEILVANTFDPLSLENFQAFDCYISTACPRISEDEEQFGKPILDAELYKELIELL